MRTAANWTRAALLAVSLSIALPSLARADHEDGRTGLIASGSVSLVGMYLTNVVFTMVLGSLGASPCRPEFPCWPTVMGLSWLPVAGPAINAGYLLDLRNGYGYVQVGVAAIQAVGLALLITGLAIPTVEGVEVHVGPARLGLSGRF